MRHSPLDDGLTYLQVSAGGFHTVLLRSDGIAVTCGTCEGHGFQTLTPDAGTCYVSDMRPDICRDRVLQLDCVCQDDSMVLTCSGFNGEEVISLNVSPSDLAWKIHKRIAREFTVPLESLRLVLPDGQLLSSVCRAKPRASLADVFETCTRWSPSS